MTTTVAADFTESFNRLSDADLNFIGHCITSPGLMSVCPELAGMLAAALDAEIGHRESLATKPDLLFRPDLLKNNDLAQAYLASVGWRRAMSHTAVAAEWAELLQACISNHMAYRLSNQSKDDRN